MKNTIFKSIFTTFILVLLTISCSKENETNDIKLSSSDIYFSKSGGTAVVAVYSNYPWGLVPGDDDNWLDFELTEERVLITCPPNYTGSERTANLYVSSHTGAAYIIIHQSNW